MRTLLFVCTANQCRSPAAEAAMRQVLRQRAQLHAEDGMRTLSTQSGTNQSRANQRWSTRSWIVRSAGILASNGNPAFSKMRVAAAARGLDLSRHRSCSVDAIRPLAFFRLILTMEQGQKEALRVEFPDVANRIYLLSEMADRSHDVVDPIGKDSQTFLTAVDEISQLIELGLDRITELIDAPSSSSGAR